MITQKPRGQKGSANFTEQFPVSMWALIAFVWILSIVCMKLFTRFIQEEEEHSLADTTFTNIRMFCNMGKYCKYQMSVLMTNYVCMISLFLFI